MMKSMIANSKQPASLRPAHNTTSWRKALAYLLIWCLVLNTSLPAVLATPSGGVFTVGTGTITPITGGNTTVVVDQAQSVVQWGAPGIGGIDTSAGESLTFSQAAGLSNSAVLNRIMSGNETQFYGTLNGADMRIFIVNPAGILFGDSAQVNVTQLVASGLNMSDSDFLNATGASPTDFVFDGGGGQVVNRGSITADDVYLAGKKVISFGAISAPGGLVVMAAGERVYLAQDGSNVVVELFAAPPDTDPDIRNASLVNAPGGKIVLAAGDVFSRAISNVAVLSAAGGTIEAHAARVENRGAMSVNGFSASGDGGTISLKSTEEIIVAPATATFPGRLTANATANGNGGSITLESQGTVTVESNTEISARGGAFTGDGGTVTITGQHFTIAGQIDASAMNTNYAPGVLNAGAGNVTIADGLNAGQLDTLYEEDIETMTGAGTGIAVQATDGIVVQDIQDNGIVGGYANFELYASGDDSSITFSDTADTISTTLGDILMSAGSGGLTLGSLQTGSQNLADVPGRIDLSTHHGGDITVQNLTIEGGQGHAEINVDAFRDLMVNGDVIVGKGSAIENTLLGEDAEALVYLKAGNDVVVNGDVKADSLSTYAEPLGSVTKSYIGIFSGTNDPSFGDTTINGDLIATARSSGTGLGTSEATVELDVWGELNWGPQAGDPIADGDDGQVHVQSKQSAQDIDADGDIARILVKVDNNLPEPVVEPDVVSTHMGRTVQGNVFDNDTSPKGEPMTATLGTAPAHAASFTLNADGTYSYTPEAGYVGNDSFTYTASAGGPTSDAVLVSITMTNTQPVSAMDGAVTTYGTPVVICALGNDSDADGDPLTVTSFAYTGTGTVVLNANNTFTYTPPSGFLGHDSFTYSITDGQTGAAAVQATVNIAVQIGSQPPPEYFMPTGSGLDKSDVHPSGCPALSRWAARQVGLERTAMGIGIGNGLASPQDIGPCRSCGDLRRAAAILADKEGSYVQALSEVIHEFAPDPSRLSDEQKASIVEAIENRAMPGNRYALAGEYITALTDYVYILNNEMGFSVQDAVKQAADKYFVPLTKAGRNDVAAYIANRLNALNLFLSLSHLPPLRSSE
jgi:filamentous hemagglutinin family protein